MRAEVLSILENLSSEQWSLPTACENWSVKDVAAHLLADDLGYLSRRRDRDGITFETSDWAELIRLINAQNEAWVQATKRLSKKVLIALLTFSGEQLHTYLQSLDLKEKTDEIAWVGKGATPMWLQVARELTEYWMHYQHICEALGLQRFKEKRYLVPVLTTFFNSLPRTFANVSPVDNTLILITTEELSELDCHLVFESGTWQIFADTDLVPRSIVCVPQDVAWRIFTKGIDPEDAIRKSQIKGDIELGRVFFQATAILA